MDYLNSNFVSIRDLDSIDDKINSLSDQKLRITKAIEEASTGNSEQFSNEENVYIKGLLTSIEQLAKAGNEAIVDNMIDANGHLRVLTDLKEAVAEKAALTKENEVLKAAALVESDILAVTGETPVEKLVEISKSVGTFRNSAVGPTLDEELLTVIHAREESLTKTLTELLDLIHWLSPKESVSIPSSTLKQISSSFAQLIDLQAVNPPEYPACWHGLEILLRPFTTRFRFHFNQSSETNKISRPEWALQFVETFLHDNMPVLELVIGNSFQKHNKIGVMEILTASLVPVREKLSKMVQIINSNIEKSTDDEAALERNGRLLSHLIFETTSFDQRLRKAYKYNPYIVDLRKSPTKKWLGLTGDILLDNGEESSAVNNWLNLELRLAKQRFDKEIIGALNAFEIDFEFNASSSHPSDVLRPSYSAYALVKLFDNLTSHFKTLSIVKYQLKYVSNIQLTFIDKYLEALQGQFKIFNESLSLKLISNFIPGSVKTDAGSSVQSTISNGVKGLEILTGLYCLLKFVIESMQEWSEELLFIQLWNHYRNVSTKKETNDSIFASAILLYSNLLDKVANKYEDFFKREIRGALKEYVNTCTWTIDDKTPRTQPSPQLLTLSTLIPAYMSYLQRTLPEIDYYLVASRVCDSYSTVIHEYVITNNQFNKVGLEQLELDIDFLAEYLYGPLLMDPNNKYSNADNKKYRRVIQSIKMMQHFDAPTAKLMKRDVDSNDAIRSQFEDRLDCLSENDIRDLLFRIV